MSAQATATVSLGASPTPDDRPQDRYDEFSRLVTAGFAEAGTLLTTDADPAALWAAYLDNAPDRRHYDCRKCRTFVETYGGLVRPVQDGLVVSALWHGGLGLDKGHPFHAAAWALDRIVSKVRVTGVFLSSDKTWGTPQTAGRSKDRPGTVWHHLHAANPAVFRHPLQTADQAAAEKKVLYASLRQALQDWSAAVAAQAVRVLEADGALLNSDKIKERAAWFSRLHEVTKDLRGRQKDNTVWGAVALAPPGFANVRSSVLSTLLDDLKDGTPFNVVQERWVRKLKPAVYQRPVAAPTAGAVARAEQIVETLGLAKSFERRYATTADVQEWLWRPPVTDHLKEARAGGMFDHLLPKKDRPIDPVDLPAVKTTWEKFRAKVLPAAAKMEVLVPSLSAAFYGLVTAADPAAPPLVQWDRDDRRNPVSWYFYDRPKYCSYWGLAATYTAVTGVFLAPPLWTRAGEFERWAGVAFFALAGCRDLGSKSRCVFPEVVRGELREVRSVVEAHSNAGKVLFPEQGDANGIAVQKNTNNPLTVRVTTAGGREVYVIDRWD